MDLGICRNSNSFFFLGGGAVRWGHKSVKLTVSLLSVLLIDVLYCLENAFASCRLCLYIWLLGAKAPTGTLPPRFRWGTGLQFPDPLCQPYLQTLPT